MAADQYSNKSTFRLLPYLKEGDVTWWNTLEIHGKRHHLRWALLIIITELLLFIWFPVVFPDSKIPMTLAYTAPAHFIILITVFFMFSLNLHNSDTEKTDQDEQEFRENISKISFSLLQTNLKVASNHINVVEPVTGKSTKTAVSAVDYSEAYLRRLDREMMIKESIASINNVIQARQSEVSSQVADVQKQRQKVSRSTTAAVSGGAGGFIAYELGSSVKNYWLLSTHKHPIDMNYWLTGTVQHFADPTKIGGSYIENGIDFHLGKNAAPASVQPVFCPSDSQSLKSSHRCDLVKQPGWAARSEELDTYVNSQFRQPELLSEALVLTVTLIVSLGAAIIGWRKSTISYDN